MVMPRAIIRDLHTGVEATRLMALVMLVFSVAPILAPLTGSALIVPFGWRAVFVAVTVVAALDLRADRASCRRRVAGGPDPGSGRPARAGFRAAPARRPASWG